MSQENGLYIAIIVVLIIVCLVIAVTGFYFHTKTLELEMNPPKKEEPVVVKEEKEEKKEELPPLIPVVENVDVPLPRPPGATDLIVPPTVGPIDPFPEKETPVAVKRPEIDIPLIGSVPAPKPEAPEVGEDGKTTLCFSDNDSFVNQIARVIKTKDK